MQRTPTITTIIPTYQRPQLLKKAIISVLNQSFKNLQVCVYDNASGDETKDIVGQLAVIDSRVKYFCHEKNIGGPENFQYGLLQNKSEYFSFLSDDDLLFPNFYELAIEKLKKHPDAAFFVGNYFLASDDNKIIHPGFKINRDGFYSINESVNTFMGKDFAPWTSMLFNYSIVKDIELSNYAINDVDYGAKIMCNFPIVVSSQVCAVFFVHNFGLSSNLKINDLCSTMTKINENIQKSTKVDLKIREEVSLRIRKNVVNFLFQKGKEGIKNQDEKKFKEVQKNLHKLEAKDLIKKLNFFFNIRKIPIFWNGLIFFRKLQLIFLKKEHLPEKKKLLELIKRLEKSFYN